jgi:tyrosinase
MSLKSLTRRDFIKGTLSVAVAASLPARSAFGQSVVERIEWKDFKDTSQYPVFCEAVRKMRANTDAQDRSSLDYWANIHVARCPHGIDYFLAWHRGFLYLLERQLREVSGLSTLTIPYWDYYKYTTLPAEFTDDSGDNPLYLDRLNTDVRESLTLSPFSSTFTNFQRGLTFAFETHLEIQPHGPIHNIIGGMLGTMKSPLDPVFWLHHANIDRLWAAWAAAGGGRQIPASTDAYWSGDLTYATDLTLPRLRARDTTTHFGYRYRDTMLPKSYPPLRGDATPQLASVSQSSNEGAAGAVLRRPPVRDFPTIGPMLRENTLVIGGACEVALAEASVSVRIPVTPSGGDIVQSMQAALKAALESAAQLPLRLPEPPSLTLRVVLDDVQMTSAGKRGGFYYKVYLNLPESGDPSSMEENNLLGTVGPFEVAAALHHAAHHGGVTRIRFPHKQLLTALESDLASQLTVSFIRVNGNRTPGGDTMTISRLWVELGAE